MKVDKIGLVMCVWSFEFSSRTNKHYVEFSDYGKVHSLLSISYTTFAHDTTARLNFVVVTIIYDCGLNLGIKSLIDIKIKYINWLSILVHRYLDNYNTHKMKSW